jgi:hypothetical protein
MLLVGLQAGAFRDLTASDERYYGAPDYSAAVRPEARKPDAVPPPDAAAQPPLARMSSGAQLRPAPRRTGAVAFPPHHVPDPTGPPRA